MTDSSNEIKNLSNNLPLNESLDEDFEDDDSALLEKYTAMFEAFLRKDEADNSNENHFQQNP